MRQQMANDDVIVEACPTSNLMIGRLGGYDDHPLHRFAPLSGGGLGVTINTDDPALFHVTIEDEYAAIWDASANREDEASKQVRLQWLAAIAERGMEGLDWTPFGDADLVAEASKCIEALGKLC